VTAPARAVRFTAREQAELAEAEPDASPLARDEVAGHTLATLISRGTELASYQEQGKYYGAPKYPHGSGYAAVFEVDAVGDDVKTVRPGDVVFAMKGHRSHQRCKADDVLRVPDGLSPQVATCARMMGISMTTLTTTTARPPATVLVTGLGLVGNLAAQVFALCGYEIIAVDPLGSRRELAQRAGLKDVRAAVPLDDEAVTGQVALVLECSGHEAAALDGCKIVRKLGEVVLVGVPWVATSDVLAHEILFHVFYNYVVLRSGWEWEIPRHPEPFRGDSQCGNFARALDWLAERRIHTDDLYEVRPPTDPQAAYQDLLHDRAGALTICFDWTALQ